MVEDTPPVVDRYTTSGKYVYIAINTFSKTCIKCSILDVMSTLKATNEPHIPRVLSGFIRQMSEEKLLVPEENIKLMSIVGQGKKLYYFKDV